MDGMLLEEQEALSSPSSAQMPSTAEATHVARLLTSPAGLEDTKSLCEAPARCWASRRGRQALLVIGGTLAVLCVLSLGRLHLRHERNTENSVQKWNAWNNNAAVGPPGAPQGFLPRQKQVYPPPPPASPHEVLDVVGMFPMAGVNLGGWFVLEDWFFSGAYGRNVMSLVSTGQGVCFPPALTSTDEPWPSEGILAQRLLKKHGAGFAADAFKAHRDDYVHEEDLKEMQQMGITSVRLPLSWAAFADALAPLHEVYSQHDPVTDTVIVPDPYYKDVASFATIPRAKIEVFLRQAAGAGLKVLLDLHSMPGGAQDGTYNGVWPLPPMFWNATSQLGQRKIPLTEAGLWISDKLIKWLEGLDPAAQAGVGGVCFMNEPGHMNAFKKFANETHILNWLAATSDLFRRSVLPSRNIHLYVNMMETAFQDFSASAVPWFFKTFTTQERRTWVVADAHWYGAWDYGHCDGRLDIGGGFRCNASEHELRKVMSGCTTGVAEGLKMRWGDDGGLMSISEFSVGTFQDARLACKDRAVLKIFLEEQLASFDSVGLQTFFWTWRLPYGPVFEPGWSFKYLTGLESKSPERVQCGPPGPSSPAV
mmetsp:Transcript_19662/g.34853  ORF Transcript_19662/g.34853 Transcript_19662/m.34853 type:complete len:593 (-) Transcript_19662:30-1808(-)